MGAGARFSFVYGSCIEMGFPWPFDSLEILSTWKRLYDPLFALILGDIVRPTPPVVALAPTDVSCVVRVVSYVV